MNSRDIAITQIVVILILFTTAWVYGENQGIEGDWRLTYTDELNRSFSFVVRISTKRDGTLALTIDGFQFDKVTLESGKLRFEGGSPRSIFEGTLKEDGLTIEGQLQQGAQRVPAVLTRLEHVSTKAEGQIDNQDGQASDEKVQDRKKLVAWWTLDEADGNDVSDSSGNGRVGRLFGNPQWKPAGGKVGGALEFDGDGDFVEIKDEPAFDLTGSITIAAWIKVNTFDKQWQAIVTKGDSSWRISRTAEEDTLAFHCTGIESVAGQWTFGIEGKKGVNEGQWHHVVGVYDCVKVSLYIDGVLDNSSEASGAIQTNDSVVIIGGNSEKISREWNGLIDEVCIIGGAIDANGVNALYSGENPITVAQTAIITVPVQKAKDSQEQFQDRISGTGSMAAVLILIIVLVGIVGGIVFFFVKASIR